MEGQTSRNQGMPNDRAKLLDIELKPYRQGEHVVLCGQVPWDASVDTTNHVAWLKESAATLRKYPRPVVFRPHPSASLPPIKGCKYSKQHLSEDLRNAWAVVTFNPIPALRHCLTVFRYSRLMKARWFGVSAIDLCLTLNLRPYRTEPNG